MTPLDALQTALAAEHAAVFVYGTLGARTSASATPEQYAAVSEAYEEHRDRRDALTERITERGDDPVASEAAYELPAGLDSPDAVVAAALEIEQRCAATYAWLVEQTSGEDRRLAVTSLTNAAVRALTFRGSPEIFPGVGDADR